MRHTHSLLALCVVLTIIPSVASAQYYEVDGIVYGITSPTEHTAEVLPHYYVQELQASPYSGTIAIPQSVSLDGTDYTVTALAESTFEGCSTVTALTLPPTIRRIGAYCFYNCNFTTLQLPDSLRRIDDHAFLYSSVETLHLPARFESFGECAFWLRNLTSVTVDEANPHYRSIGGWLYSRDSLTLCLVPDGTTGAVSVPPYVRHLGPMAFGFCSRITAVALPDGLTTIGDFAFNCCSEVDNVVVPATVSRLGLCPFSYCPQLDHLSLASGNTHYVMDGLMVYSAGYDTLVSCHKSGATVALNPNVKVLGGFENNTWLRNISIPESVTDILDNCFNGCQFTSIALPPHMRSIGRKAFSENDRLASVTMPQTLLTLGQGAFEHCYSLTAIAIPDSLRVIPKEAFNSCIKLSAITWGNAVEEIGDYAFWALSQMSSTHVSTLDLPATLRRIGEAAFGACNNSLREVHFYGPLDTMGSYVFSGANLINIRFAAGLPPAVVGEGPLEQMGSLERIYIPCGYLDEWTDHVYWGRYANKMIEDCGSIDDAEADGLKVYNRAGRIVVEGAEGEVVQVFDAVGRAVHSKALTAGLYLVKVGSRPARKVMVVQ